MHRPYWTERSPGGPDGCPDPTKPGRNALHPMTDPAQFHPLAEAAHAAFAGARSRFRRARKAFLDEGGAEPLHDVRVALRRLRAALALHGPFVRLPRRLTPARLRKLGRRLAALRDLDVTLMLLAEVEAPPAEREALAHLRGELALRRGAATARAQRMLAGRRTRRWRRALARWVRRPRFTDAAVGGRETLVREGIALVERIRAHPGWSVEPAPDGTLPPAVEDRLHELRRRAKQARYQLDLVTEAGCAGFGPATHWLEEVQVELGLLQDLRVARALVQEVAGPWWRARLPSVVALLESRRAAAWAAWLALRVQRVTLPGPMPAPA